MTNNHSFFSGAVQARDPTPMPRLSLVAARQGPRPRRRHRCRHHRAVQRRQLPRHLHRPGGRRGQELHASAHHHRLDRYRAGAARPQELLLAEGHRVRPPVQPCVSAEEGVERRPAGQARDIRGARQDL